MSGRLHALRAAADSFAGVLIVASITAAAGVLIILLVQGNP